MAAGALSIPPGFAQFSFKVVSNTVGHVALFTIGGQLTSGTMTPAQGSALMVKVGAALAPIPSGTADDFATSAVSASRPMSATCSRRPPLSLARPTEGDFSSHSLTAPQSPRTERSPELT